MRTSILVLVGLAILAVVVAAFGGIWILRSGPREAKAGHDSGENRYTAETKEHKRLMECYEMAIRMDEQRAQTLSQLDPNVIGAAKNEAADAKEEAQVTVPVGQSLTIDSIGMSDDGFYALVNGVLVHEGDMVEGYRVSRIGQNKVELEKDGQVMVLFMN